MSDVLVHKHVRLARAAVRELHLAHIALEGFDAEMNPHVTRQVRALDKLLRAVGAFVTRTIVNQHVVTNGLLALKKVDNFIFGSSVVSL